mmetsp:Transcript_5891/g.10441  ORF Transcript_5891/g.10441 Transcript_5891/m.10441 type:complete len:103 (-) Transcript_5891:534-842(-)|eukprot:CAMPEP_0198291540 /NCGR_PEP_ID=MMETSP1449-20131203/9038_1 /TAXON_ID=420275 /ORGANISM="Attheya septentrionalis, Strain CCMP2084" /LENGTH=102 /DNA_ID=CAMNT_0043990193 /DNA_START=127 /DNA_END=435 /DNA_ORIENTATION=+
MFSIIHGFIAPHKAEKAFEFDVTSVFSESQCSQAGSSGGSLSSDGEENSSIEPKTRRMIRDVQQPPMTASEESLLRRGSFLTGTTSSSLRTLRTRRDSIKDD